MAGNDPNRWKQDLKDAASHAEEDVRRLMAYLNDEVVPDIRRNGSQALRYAAEELQRLAQRMDDRRATSTGAAPPPPAAGDRPKP